LHDVEVMALRIALGKYHVPDILLGQKIIDPHGFNPLHLGAGNRGERLDASQIVNDKKVPGASLIGQGQSVRTDRCTRLEPLRKMGMRSG
jgi:hypothetical protein